MREYILISSIGTPSLGPANEEDNVQARARFGSDEGILTRPKSCPWPGRPRAYRTTRERAVFQLSPRRNELMTSYVPLLQGCHFHTLTNATAGIIEIKTGVVGISQKSSRQGSLGNARER